MIKDIFKDYSFTFSEWIKLYKYDAFLNAIFPNEYCYFNNERKKQILIKHAFNG